MRVPEVVIGHSLKWLETTIARDRWAPASLVAVDGLAPAEGGSRLDAAFRVGYWLAYRTLLVAWFVSRERLIPRRLPQARRWLGLHPITT